MFVVVLFVMVVTLNRTQTSATTDVSCHVVFHTALNQLPRSADDSIKILTPDLRENKPNMYLLDFVWGRRAFIFKRHSSKRCPFWTSHILVTK